MVDIDSETLFNAAAALVATIAVVMFVTSVDLGYSPVSEAALVVTFLAGVFAITQRSEDYQLILFGYAVVVTALLALFFDLVGTFDVGSELTVLGLLVLAALLFGLRTRLDAESHFVSGRRATYGFVAVGALAAAVVLVDVATGGIAYELQ
jgi:FtsH-binding integral membrane protein